MQLRTTGASRTDQGVHARGQCVHFDVLPEKQFDDFAQFEYSCNRMLPDDIRIFNVTRAPLGNSEQLAQDRLFHATTSSTGKLYSYRFCTAPFIEPNQRNYCTHVWYPVDISLFEHCLSLFVGTHDFTAFANQVEQTLKVFNEKNIQLRRERTVESIRLIDEGAGYYRVEFRIRSALYRMIRNIVGTSLRVAAGDMPLTQLQQLLAEAPSRIQNPAKSAPPQGLCLEHVYYDHY